jgi:twitching motility two-component system response regulator PilH
MKHALIPDDSPIQTHICKTLLQKNQTRVSVANKGEGYLAKAHEKKPDLVLIDIVVLGKSGFQAVRTLNRKPETLTIPLITISNKKQKTDKIWGTRQGAKDYQAKPETENVLMVSIDGALC